MAIQAIYLSNGQGLDAAIARGLCEAGCQIVQTNTVAETLKLLQHVTENAELPDMPAGPACLLVAEVQAGAITLLTLLRSMADERLCLTALPVLLLDHDGTDIHTAIRALQLGAHDYLLAADPDMQRELAARLLAERIVALHGSTGAKEQGSRGARETEDGRARKHANVPAPVLPRSSAPLPPGSPTQYEWDAAAGVVRTGDSIVRLSRTEGRIFYLLAREQGRAVPVNLLIAQALLEPHLDMETGAERLRSHVMRLRRKLAICPHIANRIVSVRGVGYMLT